MANTPIPTHSTGDVLTSGDWNDLTPLNTSVGFFGIGGSLLGSAPPTNAPNILFQTGYATPTCATGNGSFTYPTAFPNGIVGVILTPIYSGPGDCTVSGTSSTNKTTCYVWVNANGSAYTGSAIPFTWLAIGY